MSAFNTFLTNNPAITPFLRDGYIYEIARGAFLAGQSAPDEDAPPISGVTFATLDEVDQKIAQAIAEDNIRDDEEYAFEFEEVVW